MSLAVFLHWAVALAPVILLLALFEALDVFHLMHIRDVALLLLLGGIAAALAYPVSGRLLDALPMGFSVYSRLIAPWIEEALKCAVVVGLFLWNRIGFKLDAAISGFAVGAGFSVVENAIYLLQYPDLTLGVWLVRGFGTAVMHGGTAAAFAVLSHQLNRGVIRGEAAGGHFHPARFVPGYGVAAGVHIVFNEFPDQPLLAMLGSLVLVPLVLLLVFRRGETEARRWLDEEAASHARALAELQSGDFPATASGRLVAELSRRISGRASPALLRDYLEVHTALVLRAECVLRGDAAADDRGDRAAFARLAELRGRLGRTTLALLRPLLPFSRNDLWEMGELHARLHR